MKRLQHLLFITGFLSVATFTGCKSHSEEKASYVSIPIEFDNSKEIKLSDFVQSMDVVPLETTSDNLMGRVGNITYRNGCYYILSLEGLGDSKLLVFKENGEYQFTFDKRGPGPGEYNELGSFAVIENSDIIIFPTIKKVIRYDSLGNFISDQKSEYAPKGISKEVNNSLFLIKRLHAHLEDRNLLIKYDIPTGKMDNFFPVTEREVRRMSGVTNFNIFSAYDGNLYFNYPFCDTIFDITSGNRKAAYYIDFGKKKLPQDLFGDEVEIIPKMRMVKRYGGGQGISGFNVSNNYLYICFADFESTKYFSLYNLKTKQILTACKILDDMYFKGEIYSSAECNVPRQYDGEDLLWTLDAAVLIGAYNNYKQRASKEDWDKFASANAKLVSVCSALKEDDNPVILRLKLKK